MDKKGENITKHRNGLEKLVLHFSATDCHFAI